MVDNNNFKERTDLSGVQATARKIREEIGRVIVGQNEMIDLLLAAVLANGHVLLEGVPGIAKTLTARLLANSMKTGFSRIQFTADLMPSDIIGTSVFNEKVSEFEFRKGPVFSSMILIDEINRAPAKTQAALFEVMEERQVTADGKTYKMKEPFIVTATQNPVEYEGTYRLPEAQLDRFLFKIRIDYPSKDEELLILNEFDGPEPEAVFSSVKGVVSAKDIVSAQKSVRAVRIEENLKKYITDIVHSTRNNSSLYLGGSPRASLAIMNSSKALAAMEGRDFVIPEDIRRTVFPALCHRVLLTPEKEMEGKKPEDIIKEILESIEVPR